MHDCILIGIKSESSHNECYTVWCSDFYLFFAVKEDQGYIETEEDRQSSSLYITAAMAG